MPLSRWIPSKKDKLPQSIQIEENYGKALPLESNLQENLRIVRELLGDPSDLITKEFEVGHNQLRRLAVLTIEGLSNLSYVHDFVLKGLMVDIRNKPLPEDQLKDKEYFDIIKEHSLSLSNVTDIPDFKSLCEKLMNGSSILLIDDYNKALALETKGWEDRGIVASSEESVVRGPRDSFNETLRTNTMLIRRRIKDINLRIVDREVGEITKTALAIVYIEGVAHEEVVNEVLDRIDLINIDGVLESSYVEELITDSPKSIFPTMTTTERPDKAVANLLEGRVVIITDGSPVTLIVPTLFVQFFQSVEDYYKRPFFASFLRLLRFACFFLALLTPSIYIALTTIHQEMIPTQLLISIAAQREKVPFPAVIEAIMMEITFEILREAGVRMPSAIGSAMSIVGALVIGEAAVSAGIVSNFMVIIVSLTAISSLIFPEYNFANPVRILRFGFIILSSIFGLFGIGMGLMFLSIHLCSLRSFGIPYMYPIAPFNLKAMKDSFVRFPLNQFHKRPSIISSYDQVRMNDRQNKINKDVEERKN